MQDPDTQRKFADQKMVPVVSTRIGAEGLELQPGKELVVVEGSADMASALIECIRDSEIGHYMQSSGQPITG